jgi:hypothetical protein
MQMARERMAAYQRERRARLKRGGDEVFPIIGGPCSGCIERDEIISSLKREIKGLNTDSHAGVIKTKSDAVKVVESFPLKRVSHSPTCGCMMCKPPKADKRGA